MRFGWAGASSDSDVIACPSGGPETAHQIINTAESGDLKYLAVSTRQLPEIAEYPDTGRTGVMRELPGGDGAAPEMKRFICREQSSEEDYWEGE